MILAGDIGGTNLRLALFSLEGGRLALRERAVFRSRELPGVTAALERFLAGRGGVQAAGIGVAGPVRNGRCEGTNLAWVVDAQDVARSLGLATVALVNDLEANALGLTELSPSAFAVVSGGEEDPEGAGALLSPGTGLGEAILLREGGRFRPLPSEGGHASFAPRDAYEIELLRSLAARYGHVSWERVLSGPGLAELYRFERERSGRPEPEWLAAEIAARGDAAPPVAAAALAGTDEVAGRTLHRFVTILGAEAGNLALKALATGGVFLGGGIAPRVLPKLLDGSFFTAFCDKGRLGPLLSRIPVRVVLDDSCALRGAARAAVSSRTAP